MPKLELKTWSLAAGALVALPLLAEESVDGLWRDAAIDFAVAASRPEEQRPDAYRTLELDRLGLRSLLAAAPAPGSIHAEAAELVLTLPLPEGGFEPFRVFSTPLMGEGLARKFPDIRTYRAESIDDPLVRVRFDESPTGFHAMITGPRGTLMIDPWSRVELDRYLVYYRQDYHSPLAREWSCRTRDPGRRSSRRQVAPRGAAAPVVKRTYRLALAATGEYTAFQGGTVALAMAEMATAISRVNGILDNDFAIALRFVDDNDLLVYTDPATDPYTNGSLATMLDENQINLDTVIGIDSYDIGHVFGTAGGGLAGLGVVCFDSMSGLPGTGAAGFGVTGLSSPIGDPFAVDYVAHEIGHQFGARHTFNGTTDACAAGRVPDNAYEPGSGSTIMAYAGLCGAEDLQASSHPYYHFASIAEVGAYVTDTTPGAGGDCPTLTTTANLRPTVEAGPGYTIPALTPFELTGSASDPNGDLLTYAWEEADLGTASGFLTVFVDDGSRPLFRSLLPTTSPSRIFPRVIDILSGSSMIGFTLPSTDRILAFRLTARDNNSLAGATAADKVSLTVVAGAGPFTVTSQETPVVWTDGTETVTWDVAGTDLPPISCLEVDLLLSTTGGRSFPIPLASATPNDGSETFVVPGAKTGKARVMVRCSDNVFFDINDSDFTVLAEGPTIFVDSFESGETSAWSTIP